MRSTFACLTTIALLLGACGDDGDPSTTTNASDSDTDGTATDSTTASTTASTTDSTTASTSASTTDSTTASTTATTDESSTDPTDATEDTGPDPDSSGGTETGGGDVCAAEKDDTPCQACIKTDCCTELEACQEADPGCACVLECLGMIPDPTPADAQACAKQCDADFIAILPPLLAVQGCRDDNCSDQKGCPPPA